MFKNNPNQRQDFVAEQTGVSPFKRVPMQNLAMTPTKADRTPIKRKKLNFDSDEDIRDVSAKKGVIKPMKMLHNNWTDDLDEDGENINPQCLHKNLFKPAKDLSKSPLLDISRHSTVLANEINQKVTKQTLSPMVGSSSTAAILAQ